MFVLGSIMVAMMVGMGLGFALGRMLERREPVNSASTASPAKFDEAWPGPGV